MLSKSKSTFLVLVVVAAVICFTCSISVSAVAVPATKSRSASAWLSALRPNPIGLSKDGKVRQEYVDSFFFMLNNFAIYQKVFGFALYASFLRGDVEDPTSFEDFTYDHAWIFQEGVSHTYNPKLYGLRKMVSWVRVNNDTKEVSMEFIIPEAITQGTYDIDVETCFFGCSEVYKGNGSFSHSFQMVRWTANFTLSEEDGRVTATKIHTSLRFDSCSLFAQNLRVDGYPITDWDAFSQGFKDEYETEFNAEKEVILSELVRMAMDVPWGIGRFTMDNMLDILSEMEEANPEYPYPWP